MSRRIHNMSKDYLDKLPINYIKDEITSFKTKYKIKPSILVFNKVIEESFPKGVKLFGIKIIFSPNMEPVELMRLY